MGASLYDFNRTIREGSRIIEDNCIIRKRDGLLHVCINSTGCRFRRNGSCIMCNYGEGHSVSAILMRKIMEQVSHEATDVDSILIGTLGSVFDESEISMENLQIICNSLKRIPVETIIFETHYSMIRKELCEWLKDKLPEKDIVIEIGLESANSYVQEECLLKKMNLFRMKEKIDLLHSYDMSVTANVLLGTPFLSVQEQITDVAETIKWAINQKVDSVVLFPVNIRKHTLLDFLYQNGKYNRIYQWQMLDVLQEIPINYLNRIHFAWYGNLIDRDEDGNPDNLPPVCCPECREGWVNFYREFQTLRDNEERKKIMELYRDETKLCSCRAEYLELKNRDGNEECHKRVEETKKWLESKPLFHVQKEETNEEDKGTG